MSLDALAPRPLSLARVASVAALGTLFALLAWRQHSLVDANAVNMLFWDQWDLYQPLFGENSLWRIFSIQHGPHRMGLGLLVTKFLADLSHWNSRWDAFAVSFTMMAAAVLGLRLAMRSGMKLGLSMAAIPVIFLNVRQYEGFVGASNLSHGAMPVLLMLTLCLAWQWKDHRLRLGTVVGLNFLLTFTGMGLFGSVLALPLIAVETVHTWRKADMGYRRWLIGALAGCILTWVLFFIDYHFWPAVDGFRFPYERPLEYLWFCALMFSNFAGLAGHGDLQIAIGCVLLSAVTGIALVHGCRVLWNGIEDNRQSVVLLCLSAFPLVFCANSAIARVFLGLSEAPAASRYVPLLAPAFLAIVIQLGQIVRVRHGMLCVPFALLLLPGAVLLRETDQKSIDWYRKGRSAWRETYLRVHDEKETDRLTGFQIFPMVLHGRLDYVEKHKLNLYAPESASK